MSDSKSGGASSAAAAAAGGGDKKTHSAVADSEIDPEEVAADIEEKLINEEYAHFHSFAAVWK